MPWPAIPNTFGVGLTVGCLESLFWPAWFASPLERRGSDAENWRRSSTPSTIQEELVEKLAALRRLSPGVRFGQLLASLAFLVEDQTDETLREIEDDSLLEVMERHRADLFRRLADD